MTADFVRTLETVRKFCEEISLPLRPNMATSTVGYGCESQQAVGGEIEAPSSNRPITPKTHKAFSTREIL